LYVEAAKQSGAGLLFDLNNINVCAANVDLPEAAWLDAVPGDLVGEIHLAGAVERTIEDETILIDSHDAPVAKSVWNLLEKFVKRHGPKPVLIERDDNLPSFTELLAERNQAQSIVSAATLELANA